MDINPWPWNYRKQIATQKQMELQLFVFLKSAIFQWGKRGNVAKPKNICWKPQKDMPRKTIQRMMTVHELWAVALSIRDLHSQRSVQDSKFSWFTHSAKGPQNKTFNLISPTKHAIRKSLVYHSLSEIFKETSLKLIWNHRKTRNIWCLTTATT